MGRRCEAEEDKGQALCSSTFTYSALLLLELAGRSIFNTMTCAQVIFQQRVLLNMTLQPRNLDCLQQSSIVEEKGSENVCKKISSLTPRRCGITLCCLHPPSSSLPMIGTTHAETTSMRNDVVRVCVCVCVCLIGTVFILCHSSPVLLCEQWFQPPHRCLCDITGQRWSVLAGSHTTGAKPVYLIFVSSRVQWDTPHKSVKNCFHFNH